MVGWEYQLFLDDCCGGEEVVDGWIGQRGMELTYYRNHPSKSTSPRLVTESETPLYFQALHLQGPLRTLFHGYMRLLSICGDPF